MCNILLYTIDFKCVVKYSQKKNINFFLVNKNLIKQKSRNIFFFIKWVYRFFFIIQVFKFNYYYLYQKIIMYLILFHYLYLYYFLF